MRALLYRLWLACWPPPPYDPEAEWAVERVMGGEW